MSSWNLCLWSTKQFQRLQDICISWFENEFVLSVTSTMCSKNTWRKGSVTGGSLPSQSLLSLKLKYSKKSCISVKEYGCTDLPMDHGTSWACKAYYHDELLCGIINSEFLKTSVLKDVAYNSGLACRKFSQMAIVSSWNKCAGADDIKLAPLSDQEALPVRGDLCSKKFVENVC